MPKVKVSQKVIKDYFYNHGKGSSVLKKDVIERLKKQPHYFYKVLLKTILTSRYSDITKESIEFIGEFMQIFLESQQGKYDCTANGENNIYEKTSSNKLAVTELLGTFVRYYYHSLSDSSKQKMFDYVFQNNLELVFAMDAYGAFNKLSAKKRISIHNKLLKALFSKTKKELDNLFSNNINPCCDYIKNFLISRKHIPTEKILQMLFDCFEKNNSITIMRFIFSCAQTSYNKNVFENLRVIFKKAISKINESKKSEILQLKCFIDSDYIFNQDKENAYYIDCIFDFIMKKENEFAFQVIIKSICDKVIYFFSNPNTFFDKKSNLIEDKIIISENLGLAVSYFKEIFLRLKPDTRWTKLENILFANSEENIRFLSEYLKTLYEFYKLHESIPEDIKNLIINLFSNKKLVTEEYGCMKELLLIYTTMPYSSYYRPSKPFVNTDMINKIREILLDTIETENASYLLGYMLTINNDLINLDTESRNKMENIIYKDRVTALDYAKISNTRFKIAEPFIDSENDYIKAEYKEHIESIKNRIHEMKAKYIRDIVKKQELSKKFFIF